MKFRVWDKSSKTMYHAGFLLTQDGQLVYEAFPEDSVPAGICEVMVSTGVTDRDGTEIWEGDIIEITTSHKGIKRLVVSMSLLLHGLGPPSILKVLGNKWQTPALCAEAGARSCPEWERKERDAHYPGNAGA